MLKLGRVIGNSALTPTSAYRLMQVIVQQSEVRGFLSGKQI
jgi:hypothetical protein